ncbi:hypothetical protein WR25_10068 [Diploscapter pachys]|uniref:Cyclic nucleotide-binding domain-containing protein n=1 Tax=Diploscapter pachys TaxID=2018661 RepID=A0A2A2JAA7_9BILA|nr:hypothetical protein WR25_10068 [Diploscapter pachys]
MSMANQARRNSIRNRIRDHEPNELDIENQYERSVRESEPFIYDTSVNPKGTMYWQWSIIVSSACLYNLIFISLPAFEETRISTDSKWLSYNLVADIIYLIDMFVQCKKNFYESGCLVTDFNDTRINYVYSCQYFCIIIIFHQYYEMMNETYYNEEREQNIYVLLDYWINKTVIMKFSDFIKKYMLSMYWSSMTMTTLGEQEIFLISRGSVKVIYSDLDKKKLKICKEGDLIGADGLFWFSDNSLENRRNYTIISVGYSEVYVLHRDNFFKVLRDYPYERERLRKKARETQKDLGEIPIDSRRYTSVEETSFEEQMLRAKFQIDRIQADIDAQYKKFIESSNNMKRRVFKLERQCNNLIRDESLSEIIETT